MNLQAQQRALQAALCERLSAADLLQAPAEPGLSVYQDAYAARLIAALRDNYTVLHRALGDEQFDALARAYLQAQPSRQPSIRWFGDRLAGFMAGDYAERLPHPSLVDIARMDWALRGAFDGADAALLRPELLMAVAPEDWPGLVFRLHPTVSQQPLAWAVEPAWRALRAYDPEAGGEAPALAEPAPLAHVLLVWREGLETRWRSLGPLEAQLLQAVAEAQPFAAICAVAAQTVDAEAAAAAVVQALQRWLAEGLLAAD